jgi:pimeloyl-ACP methyl ester carboxylesterase
MLQPQYISVEGCKTSFFRQGSGTTMLFLHAEHGGSEWLPLMERLSQSFDLIVPEHPGFGRSDTPPWLDDVADLAQFYRSFMEAFALREVHVVGASIGGWIALEIAARCVSPICSLSLLSPAGVNVKGLQKGDIFLWSPEKTVLLISTEN